MLIEVIRDSRKCWSLKIDGINPLSLGASIWGGKLAIKRYLQKNHGIDLLTDQSIKRNYTEYTVKKVKEANEKTLLIKEKRAYQ